ncbi:fibronectin type III domain protein [Dictyocaulus viviparus]|uniref:Fibronectin type III domain protein n=1 Tax=Dictyocaulus viviparus TaxID=29172 RepID=A0A0D8XWI0_DICVI|nr:fibronectin type III domain protein [Dictyocaulus viviparus]
MKFTIVVLLMHFYLIRVVVVGDHPPHELRVPDRPENVRIRTTATTATLWWDPPSDKTVLVCTYVCGIDRLSIALTLEFKFIVIHCLEQLLIKSTVFEYIEVRGYTVSYGIATPSRRIVIEGVNTNSFTLNRLEPDTDYVFAVSAYNEADGEDGEPVILSAKTLPSDGTTALSLWPPIAVRANSLSPDTVTVSWEDPNPEQDVENEIDGIQRHYLIQFCTVPINVPLLDFFLSYSINFFFAFFRKKHLTIKVNNEVNMSQQQDLLCFG